MDRLDILAHQMCWKSVSKGKAEEKQGRQLSGDVELLPLALDANVTFAFVVAVLWGLLVLLRSAQSLQDHR